MLREFLPDYVVTGILNVQPPRLTNADDEYRWANSADGSFSTKTAYLAVKNPPPLVAEGNFSTIWKWQGPERVKLFLWKAMNKCLLTNAERARRHMTTCALCPICGGNDESLFHTFRDCNRIKILWNCLQIPNPRLFYSNLDWGVWLNVNLSRNNSETNQNWSLTFAMILDGDLASKKRDNLQW